MDNTLASLIAANTAFVGSHFALSHPLRGGLVKALGEKGFMGLYSLVSLATFAWIAIAFRAVGPGGAMLWNGQATPAWVAASLLTIPAVLLLAGSVTGTNPALPGIAADAVAKAPVRGALAVTRHPMMWGIALWALAHIIIAPNGRTLATAGAMAILALVGAHLQDRKKRALLGDAWAGWEARTSYWPRWGALARIGAKPWAIAIALWLALTWAHVWLAYVPAGIWRWVG